MKNLQEYKRLSVPESLKVLQCQFGDSISTPFIIEDSGDYSLQSDLYSKDLLEIILPNADAGLSSEDRLGIYNEQYWFRLFSVMQEEYPLLCNLIGASELNKLTTAYLKKHPSISYSLRELSFKLPEFIREDHDWNLEALHQIVDLEYYYILAFDSEHCPELSVTENVKNNVELIAERPIKFQDHWFLFEEDWNLVESRKKVQFDNDIEIDLEDKTSYWVIYRSKRGVEEEQLGPIQFYLLSMLYDGLSINEACTVLEAELDDESLSFLAKNIQSWFAYWQHSGWFKG